MTQDFLILFIGTPTPFATVPLKAIATTYHLAGIIESAPRGFVTPSPFKSILLFANQRFGPDSLWRLAKKMRVPYFFYTRDNKSELLNFMQVNRADIGCVASMHHLLPPEALSIPRLGFINLHPSLLPDLRGPHVWTWLYYFNKRQSGITIHQIDKGEDSGAILKQVSFPIFIGMKSELLTGTTIRLGASLLLELLLEIHQGHFASNPQPQNIELHRARRLQKNDDLFHYQSWELEHTYHFLQGVRPWYTPFNRWQRGFGLLDWVAVGFERAEVDPQWVGAIHLGRRGFYFAHRQGKILLRPKFHLFRLVLALVLCLALLNILMTK